jgi:hypothetical protein
MWEFFSVKDHIKGTIWRDELEEFWERVTTYADKVMQDVLETKDPLNGPSRSIGKEIILSTLALPSRTFLKRFRKRHMSTTAPLS